MYKSDPTYLESHLGYEAFIFEKFEVVYSDGSKNNIIDENMPINKRKFEICSGCDFITFRNVITKKLDFSVNMAGVSIKNTGESQPFKSNSNYKYKKYFRVYTFLDMIGSI